MPPKITKPKALVQPMASSTGTEDATLQEEVETLRRQLVESESRAATLRATIEETRNTPAFTDLDYERIAAAMLQQQLRDRSQDRRVDSRPESDRRSPKQPDPPLLSDGKDPTYTSWSILVQAKLQDNDDHFPSENSKLTYVYGRTTGAAQAHLEPRFEYGAPNPFLTVDEVMAHLAAIYQNPMRQAIAQDDYYNLNQGRTELFSEFLTKFQHLAGLGAIPAANWRQDLYRKLNVLYQKNIAPTLPFYDTFEKLVVQCQHLEHVLYPLLARQQAERNTRVSLPRTGNRTILARVPAAAAAPVVPTSSALVPARQSPAPLPWRSFPARETTPARNPPENPSGIVCYNCGKAGHKSIACPEPRKPGAIHEIDEQDSGSDSTDATNEESGKEDP
jgi:hypothetical protein